VSPVGRPKEREGGRCPGGDAQGEVAAWRGVSRPGTTEGRRKGRKKGEKKREKREKEKQKRKKENERRKNR
jgi:hypothetical protein